MENENIAELLRQISEKSGGVTITQVIEKCKKAALKGKNHIELEISESDYRTFAYSLIRSNLIVELEKHGFLVKSTSRMPFFSLKFKYYLVISW